MNPPQLQVAGEAWDYKIKFADFLRFAEPELGWGEPTSEAQLLKVIGLALLLVFMVTAALFESMLQPFIIMVAVPLALVGVFFGF